MASRIELMRSEIIGNTTHSGNQKFVKAVRENYRRIQGVETKGERTQRRREERDDAWEREKAGRVLERALATACGFDGSNQEIFGAEVRYLASMGITVKVTTLIFPERINGCSSS